MPLPFSRPVNPSLTTTSLGRISYTDALAIQEQTVAALREGLCPETLFLLEHHPVYTIGRRRDKSSLGMEALLPHPVVEINRGGQATFHGYGQLVGYPILNLDSLGRDLHLYLRFLEDVLIALCSSFGVSASRREGLTGTWVGEKKIASIGVGVRHWISMHGFAINITPESLEGFRHIVPCGIAAVQMTDLSTESGTPLSLDTVASAASSIFSEKLTSLRNAISAQQ